jgi:hypothetical protein
MARAALPLRSPRVFPVGIPLADLTVATVNNQLALGTASDLSRCQPRLCLRPVNGPRSAIRSDLNFPTLVAWNYVDVTFGHAQWFPNGQPAKLNRDRRNAHPSPSCRNQATYRWQPHADARHLPIGQPEGHASSQNVQD